ncbi:MAG: glycine cleavage system aminomethyltransferase GcvT [Verrucomicrobia bacterium]|nr:glycine cleavage system aminomethyltransferase GcvT [Verrucomicrobiota bacterium]
MLKRTPLYENHQKLGARLVEFGGWEMPVQYTGIVDEHQTVRTAAGMFDISHMGEVRVSGPSALAFLNGVLTNDLRKLAVGQGQYTLLCNERGGVIDDLYAYRLADQEFLLIINASRIDSDVGWLQAQFRKFAPSVGSELLDISDQIGAVAVQGPKVAQFIDQCFPASTAGGADAWKPSDLAKNQICAVDWNEHRLWISRTGYTGEDGFEILADAQSIVPVWEQVLKIGQPYGLKPAGLGARDTLRTEACYALYGHELDEDTTPLEAGLGFFVALDKGEFVGRSALVAQKQKGVGKKCVAFKMSEKSAPARPHYPIWSGGTEAQRIGEVVSGTQSPSLGIGIGLGYVPPASAKPGTEIQIEIRGKRFGAAIVPKPIYRKPAISQFMTDPT